MKGWLGIACNAFTGEVWVWEMPGVSKWYGYFTLGMYVKALSTNEGYYVTPGSWALYEMDGDADAIVERYMTEQYPALRFMEVGIAQ